MNRWRALGLSAAGLATLCASAMAIGAAPDKRNAAIRPLLDCRKIADTTERLACFDRESATLDAADAKNEIAVMDKEDVKKTQRSLFGLSLPKLPFLSGGDDEKDTPDSAKLDEIESKIVSARPLKSGEWLITLEDGASWQTVEAMPYGKPAPNQSIVIKRAAFGSYKGSINKWIPVKMKRVN